MAWNQPAVNFIYSPVFFFYSFLLFTPFLYACILVLLEQWPIQCIEDNDEYDYLRTRYFIVVEQLVSSTMTLDN